MYTSMTAYPTATSFIYGPYGAYRGTGRSNGRRSYDW
jgi:hypothetical protein